MSQFSPFLFPPLLGNAEAYVIYYAIFLVVHFALALRYLQRWNLPIFVGLWLFLILSVLGSVAFVKLSYAPFLGSYYSLYIFGLTTAPTFLIFSMHIIVQRILHIVQSANLKPTVFRPSSRTYLIVTLSIDALSLLFQVIGAAYADAQSTESFSLAQRGFDLLTAAMAIQLVSMTVMLLVGLEVTISFMRYRAVKKSAALSTAQESVVEKGFRKPRFFLTFLISFLFNGLIIFARTIVRAVNVAGGINGPLSNPTILVNVEAILLFVVILVITILHPVFALQFAVYDSFISERGGTAISEQRY